MDDWNFRDSLELYQLPAWGGGYFDVGEAGRVLVKPYGERGGAIDLRALIEDMRTRGLRTPLLLRFSDILADRINKLAEAFAVAGREHGYRGRFRGVYPMKVNPQRHVVEEIISFGNALGIGLEAGSKPELLVVLALLDTPDALIICNGYKDRAYIETALLAKRLGRRPVIVIDRVHEIDLVVKIAEELQIRPELGVRTRLSAPGAGQWVDSSGDKSKFGLTAPEIVEAVERLRHADMLDCLKLLHFHIGSQITDIRAHKDALREATRIFVGLHGLGAAPSLLDVGGGLGVDYTGAHTAAPSSKNYSVQEYANDVVAAIQAACDDAHIDHPDIVTEAGRWMTAHHALLVFDVLGVNRVGAPCGAAQGPEPDIGEGEPRIFHDLDFVLREVNPDNVIEYYHDALQAKQEAAMQFSVGQLDLKQRARLERLFWRCCEKIHAIAQGLPELPEELMDLDRALTDTYYGNLSVFQSAPDHWAVQQLFPVMPLQRLDEKPTRRGIIADLTCDSHGKIRHFIGGNEVKDVLELHAPNGRPYYLGIFLLGAYQEILGDLHNLFGDTDAVHVRLGEDGAYRVEHVVEGEDVRDVLAYVEYDQAVLKEKVRRLTEEALRRKDIALEEAALLKRRYDQGLWDYTYLTPGD